MQTSCLTLITKREKDYIMSSDERLRKDSRKKKSSRSRSDAGASRRTTSRSRVEERSSSGFEEQERPNRRKKSAHDARKRFETPSQRESSNDMNEDDNDREDNIFTRGIPAPPLAAAEPSPRRRVRQSTEMNDDTNLDDDEADGDTGPMESKGFDGRSHEYSISPELDFENNSSLSNLNVALERCEWEVVYNVLVSLKGKGLKKMCESPSYDPQSTVFQTIVWKAPTALSLFLQETLSLSDDLPVLCASRDADGNTALHLICANLESVGKSELTLLKRLVMAAPESVEVHNSDGDTPLHLLVSCDACSSVAAEKAITILLKESVDPALARDSSGATPLHTAIAHGAHDRVLMTLLEYAPDAAKVSDERGLLPLHYAAAFWKTHVEVVEFLVSSYPVALTVSTVNGDTPLHLLLSNKPEHIDEIDLSMMRIVQFLAGTGEQILCTQNVEKLTPLHCCALFDVPSQVTGILMSHPGSKNASLITNMSGATPLHIAVAKESVATSIGNVVALATTGAAASIDFLNRSPLHVAVQNVESTATLIQLLFDLSPEATSRETLRGHLPLHLAAQSHATEAVVKKLLRLDPKAAEIGNKSGNTPLHDAAKYSASYEVIQLMLETYPDAVYVQNQYGNLPLHCATAYQAPPEVIQLLLEAWPDGAAMQNRNQDAPLHYAAAYTKSLDAIQPLISAAPAAVLLLNSNGQSPIDRARANKAPDNIIELLEASADEWAKRASQDGWGAFSQDMEGSAS